MCNSTRDSRPKSVSASRALPHTAPMVVDPRASARESISPFVVLAMTTAMAFASALGALPFAFRARKAPLSTSFASLANACACGVMLAASFDLIHEGQPHGGVAVVFGVAVGAAMIAKAQRWLSAQGDDLVFLELRGADAARTMMIVGIMAAHAFGEGCGVGVSFSGNRGWRQGRLVTLAIGAHNVPEGLAVANALASRGVGAKACAWWCVATSLPQPLLAVPAFMFVEAFQPVLPFSLGFAAGCMVWIVFAELLPDALKDANDPKAVATTVTLSAGALELFRMVMEAIESDGGAIEPMELATGRVASSALDVARAASVYVPVIALALMYMTPRLYSPVSVAATTGLGVAASTAAASASIRLLWAAWRGVVSGGVALVVLGSIAAASGGILAFRITRWLPSMKSVRPWSDLDDEGEADHTGGKKVDIEGRAESRFGNVVTQEALLAFLAASAFAVADGAHATSSMMTNTWYAFVPALMRAAIRVAALVFIAASTDKRLYVVGAVALVGVIFVSAASMLGDNHSSSATCIFFDTVAAIATLMFVATLKPLVLFALMTKHGDVVGGLTIGVTVTVIFAVSSWAFCTGTSYCDII